jgi:hypothetical protein
MNRIIIKILLLLLLYEGSLVINGQQNKPGRTGERIVLFCDRSLYIAGEKILFSAFLQSGEVSDKTGSSRILYCELITPDGAKITGNKFLFKNFNASGYLDIADDILTGTYYLRTYTKVMRNNGPYHYHYTIIKIVNPNRSEVQGLTNSISLPDSLNIELNPGKTGDLLHISIDKSQYYPRDTVQIAIDEIGTFESSVQGLCLAVIPEFSISLNQIRFSEGIRIKNTGFYYPETRGLSITGRLEDEKTGRFLPYTLVNLSILGRGRDFMSVQTDSEGRFFFSLPDYTGSRDLFLCAGDAGSAKPQVLVDNDFCSIPVHIPTDIFSLTRQERETAYNMAVNLQVEAFFRNDTNSYEQADQLDNKAFYGKPDDILYIDDYIQLPTLEEYFNGLPTPAKVRKRKGEKYFRVIGSQGEITDFDPLTMVDFVAIDNPDKILAIPPTSISRIETVSGLYVKGDQTYGGIINIISRHNDFAGIDMPSSGVFINYGFLSAGNDNQISFPNRINHPDTRNTLYWEPDLKLNMGNKTKISFIASDTQGRYAVVLSGVDNQGESFIQIARFEIMLR